MQRLEIAFFHLPFSLAKIIEHFKKSLKKIRFICFRLQLKRCFFRQSVIFPPTIEPKYPQYTFKSLPSNSSKYPQIPQYYPCPKYQSLSRKYSTTNCNFVLPRVNENYECAITYFPPIKTAPNPKENESRILGQNMLPKLHFSSTFFS